MVTVLAVLGVLAVLFAAAVLSTREEPLLADAPRDAADVPLPEGPLTPKDVEQLRFSLAPRGYRMSEVDLALERLAAELADRDRRIALLEAAAARKAPVQEATPADLPVPPAPAPPAPAPVAPPAPAAPSVGAATGVPPLPPVTEVVPADDTAPATVPGEAPGSAPEAPPATAPQEPLPPADLGAELQAEERAEQAAETHAGEPGAAAATTDVSQDQLLSALEESSGSGDARQP